VDYPVLSFGSGYLSPLYQGRVDMPKYRSGCQHLVNYIPLPQGPATRRPGTYYLNLAKSSPDVRLTHFVYTRAYAYVLEMSNEAMRFYDSSGQVTCKKLTVSAAPTPSVWAAGDVLTGGTSGSTCKVQERISDTEYYIQGPDSDFTGGETLSDGTDSATLSSVADDTEPIELTTPWDATEVWDVQTASKDDVMYLVHSGYEVRKIQWKASNWFDITTPSFTTSGLVNDFTTSAYYPTAVTFFQGRLILGCEQTLWGSQANTHETFNVDGTDTMDAWEFEYSFEDGSKITWISSQNALIIGTESGPFALWSETELLTGGGDTVFNPKRAGAYGCDDIQAIYAGNTVLFVQRNKKRIRSVVYSFEQDVYDAPDLTQIAEGILNAKVKQLAYQMEPYPIIWIVDEDGDVISLFLSSAEGTASWSKHEFFGEVQSVAVIPTSGEDRVYFLVKRTFDNGLKTTEEWQVEYMVSFDWGDEQENCFFVEAGVMLDGGDAESIDSITKSSTCEIDLGIAAGLSDDDLIRIYNVTDMPEVNNNVYMIKNGAAGVFDLYTEDGTSQIDSSSFSAAATDGYALKVYNSVTTLSHVSGEDVAILGDGAVQANATVDASGDIILSRAVNKVIVGLPYQSYVSPMPIAEARSRKKKTFSLFVEVYKTIGLKVGPDLDSLTIIPFRSTEAMGEAVPLFTGEKTATIDNSFEYTPSVYLVQDQPLPSTILAVWERAGVY